MSVHQVEFSIDEAQRELLEKAKSKLGLESIDKAAETLVKQKLENMARRIGSDGRGKAIYRHRPTIH